MFLVGGKKKYRIATKTKIQKQKIKQKIKQKQKIKTKTKKIKKKKIKKKSIGKQVNITEFFKKTDINIKTVTVNVFTDGSCINNKRGSTKSKGGIGVFWNKNDKDNVAEPFLLFPITNNRTEFYAIIKAIELFTKKYENFKNKNKTIILKIHTDSMIVINTMAKWITIWKKRGWKKADGNTPLNTDLIFCLDSLIENNKDNFKVKFKHVKAHLSEPKDKSSDDHWLWYGNNEADKLASIGQKKLKITQQILKCII